MTNEDKVKLIVDRAKVMLPMMRSQLGDSVTGYAEYFEKSLLNMAEWKDQQFKEITARVRKWLYEHGKLDALYLVKFDMEMERLWEGKED